MNNEKSREPDGYIYNSRRNIRTNGRIERLYRDQDDNFLAFILDNGFREFPNTSK
ncbi:hypothetical protein ACSL9E_003593 [Vibrio vulnificus]